MENFSHEKVTRIKTQRGMEKILFEGYSYNYVRTTKEKHVWRCRFASCGIYLHSTIDCKPIKEVRHNHDPDFEANRIEFALKYILNRSETTTESARDIIDRVLVQFSDIELIKAPTVKAWTDLIKKNRNKKHIKSIYTPSDIPESICKTSSGEVFLQFDSGIIDKNRIVVFSTDFNLSQLEKSKLVLMDGTFKCVPTGFKQMYTLVAKIKRCYVPLVYVLMYGKNELSYKKICNFLQEKIPNFNPESFFVDFEAASRKAFSNVFKKSNFYGCLFHFSQNIWRKIQELRLVSIYKKEERFRSSACALLSLAFVPVDKIKLYFDELVCEIKKGDFYEEMKDILIYFKKNYIQSSKTDLEFYNVYDRVLRSEPRTTNSLEGFHRGWNNLFPKAHPDIGLLGEQLIKENTRNKQKILKALDNSSNSLNCTSQKDEYEKDILSLVIKFKEFSPIEYLYAISSLVHFPLN